MTVTVAVPASSANLGPGFDCLGLALNLENTLTLTEATAPEVTVDGEGIVELRRNASNLAYRSAVAGYELSGKHAPPFAMHLSNTIPLARGLGSSSAAIVAGVVAGAALAGVEIDRARLVVAAAELEGHPDNVAPAIYGGFTVAVGHGSGVQIARLDPPDELQAVVFIPETRLSTSKARAVLPAMYSREDAVFNIGHASLMVAAFCSGDLGLLGVASEDRLHQPARTKLVPALPKIMAAAREAGALMAALSGAGPSVLALCTHNSRIIGSAMEGAAASAGYPGRTVCLNIQRQGARLLDQSAR